MAQRKHIQRIVAHTGGGAGLESLRDQLREFVAEREWQQFHTPKNLAVAISVEAGELLERFQWAPDAGLTDISSIQLTSIEEEMADVLLYLLRMADVLNIDLLDSAHRKIAKNALKYPVEKARGSSKKYTEL